MFKKGKNNPPMEIPGQSNPAALQVDLAPLTVTGLAGSSVQDKKCFKVRQHWRSLNARTSAILHGNLTEGEGSVQLTSSY
jgi:hypothetical protein